VQSLEQRIADALVSDTITSAALLALAGETDAAILAAAETAAAERCKALDPALSPDPRKARQAMEDAEFARDRLKTVLPRLHQRSAEVAEGEAHQRWEQDFAAALGRAEAAARRWERVPELIGELVSIFASEAEIARGADRVNAAASALTNEHRRLPRAAELLWRGLQQFTCAEPSIAGAATLPDPARPELTAWPPRQAPMAAMFAPPPHRGDAWHEGIAEERETRRAESERVSQYYNQQTREREERDAEQSKRSAA
jgi:hypothetical protein